MSDRAPEILASDIPESARERLWRRVNIGTPDECWPWRTGHPANRPTFVVAGVGTFTAARFALAIKDGRIGAGIYACHTCDNHRCVNPAHLWPGTPSDNMADRFKKGRHWKGKEPSQRKPKPVYDIVAGIPGTRHALKELAAAMTAAEGRRVYVVEALAKAVQAALRKWRKRAAKAGRQA